MWVGGMGFITPPLARSRSAQSKVHNTRSLIHSIARQVPYALHNPWGLQKLEVSCWSKNKSWARHQVSCRVCGQLVLQDSSSTHPL